MKPNQSGIIVQISKNRYKFIKEGKYFINRNTPVGEDAEFYEIKPFGGKKLIRTPLAYFKDGQVEYRSSYKAYCKGNFPKELLEFINQLKLIYVGN
jgi:hypothetical protein